MNKIREKGHDFVEKHHVPMKERLKEVFKSLGCLPEDDSQAFSKADHWIYRTTDRAYRVEEVNPCALEKKKCFTGTTHVSRIPSNSLCDSRYRDHKLQLNSSIDQLLVNDSNIK